MNLNLSLWNDTPTKSAILDFVAKVTDQNNKSYVRRRNASLSLTMTARCGAKSRSRYRLISSCGGGLDGRKGLLLAQTTALEGGI